MPSCTWFCKIFLATSIVAMPHLAVADTTGSAPATAQAAQTETAQAAQTETAQAAQTETAPADGLAPWDGTWQGSGWSGDVALTVAEGAVSGLVVVGPGRAEVEGKVKEDGTITATGRPRGDPVGSVYIHGKLPEVVVETNNVNMRVTLTR